MKSKISDGASRDYIETTDKEKEGNTENTERKEGSISDIIFLLKVVPIDLEEPAEHHHQKLNCQYQHKMPIMQ